MTDLNDYQTATWEGSFLKGTTNPLSSPGVSQHPPWVLLPPAVNYSSITREWAESGLIGNLPPRSPMTEIPITMSWFQDADFPVDAPGGSVAQAIITRSAGFGVGGPGGQLVRMGKQFGTAQFGTDGANGLGLQLVPGTNASEAFLAVAKITLPGNANPDTVRIFLNPELNSTELNNADADQIRTPNLNDGFDAFGFKVEGGAPLNAAFDEFRFGASLAEVIGDDLILTPGVNVDQFNDYAAGDGLNGLNGGSAGVSLNGAGIQSVSLLADDIRAGFSYRDISCKFGSDDPALLAYEPFNYDAGLTLDGAGGVNAFWDGAWEQDVERENSSSTILEGSLEYPDFDPIGNKAEFNLAADGEGLTLKRNLAFPVESDGSTYWLTFLMNTTDPTAANNIGNLTLVNTNIGDRGGRRFGVGRNFGTQQLGTIVVTTNSPRTTDVADNGRHWIVCRVQTTAEEGGLDTVSLWIDPALDTEPDTADASHYQYFTTAALQDGFNAMHIRVLGVNGNEAPYVTEFDEIRLATAWRSARIAVSTVEPTSADPLQVAVYPNPAADETNVRFDLAEPGPVSLDLFSLNGRHLQALYRGSGLTGTNNLNLGLARTASLPNGMYLIRVSNGSRATTRKLMIYR